MPETSQLMNRAISTSDELEIWNFIHEEVIKNQDYNRVDEALFEDFLEKSDLQISADQLYKHYLDAMRGTLYKCALRKEQILELYRKLKIEISKHVEEMIESLFSVVLHLNSDRYLEDYRFLPGHSGSSTPQRASRESIDTEVPIEMEQRMWSFLEEKFERLRPQRTRTSAFWQEFLWHTRVETGLSATRLADHFVARMTKDVWSARIRRQVKMAMLETLEIPVDERKRLQLLERESISISVDESTDLVKNWRILEFDDAPEQQRTPKRRSTSSTTRAAKKRRRSEPEPTTPNAATRSKFTEKDDVAMWRFVLSEMEKGEEPLPKGLVLWHKYTRESPKCHRSPQNLASHYRKLMEPKLHLMPLSIREKVRLYSRLQIPIPLAIRISAKQKLGYEIVVDADNNIKRIEKVEPEEQEEEALSDAPEFLDDDEELEEVQEQEETATGIRRSLRLQNASVNKDHERNEEERLDCQ